MQESIKSIKATPKVNNDLKNTIQSFNEEKIPLLRERMDKIHDEFVQKIQGTAEGKDFDFYLKKMTNGSVKFIKENLIPINVIEAYFDNITGTEKLKDEEVAKLREILLNNNISTKVYNKIFSEPLDDFIKDLDMRYIRSQRSIGFSIIKTIRDKCSVPIGEILNENRKNDTYGYNGKFGLIPQILTKFNIFSADGDGLMHKSTFYKLQSDFKIPSDKADELFKMVSSYYDTFIRGFLFEAPINTLLNLKYSGIELGKMFNYGKINKIDFDDSNYITLYKGMSLNDRTRFLATVSLSNISDLGKFFKDEIIYDVINNSSTKIETINQELFEEIMDICEENNVYPDALIKIVNVSEFNEKRIPFYLSVNSIPDKLETAKYFSENPDKIEQFEDLYKNNLSSRFKAEFLSINSEESIDAIDSGDGDSIIKSIIQSKESIGEKLHGAIKNISPYKVYDIFSSIIITGDLESVNKENLKELLLAIIPKFEKSDYTRFGRSLLLAGIINDPLYLDVKKSFINSIISADYNSVTSYLPKFIREDTTIFKELSSIILESEEVTKNLFAVPSKYIISNYEEVIKKYDDISVESALFMYTDSKFTKSNMSYLLDTDTPITVKIKKQLGLSILLSKIFKEPFITEAFANSIDLWYKEIDATLPDKIGMSVATANEVSETLMDGESMLSDDDFQKLTEGRADLIKISKDGDDENSDENSDNGSKDVGSAGLIKSGDIINGIKVCKFEDLDDLYAKGNLLLERGISKSELKVITSLISDLSKKMISIKTAKDIDAVFTDSNNEGFKITAEILNKSIIQNFSIIGASSNPAILNIAANKFFKKEFLKKYGIVNHMFLTAENVKAITSSGLKIDIDVLRIKYEKLSSSRFNHKIDLSSVKCDIDTIDDAISILKMQNFISVNDEDMKKIVNTISSNIGVFIQSLSNKLFSLSLSDGSDVGSYVVREVIPKLDISNISRSEASLLFSFVLKKYEHIDTEKIRKEIFLMDDNIKDKFIKIAIKGDMAIEGLLFFPEIADHIDIKEYISKNKDRLSKYGQTKIFAALAGIQFGKNNPDMYKNNDNVGKIGKELLSISGNDILADIAIYEILQRLLLSTNPRILMDNSPDISEIIQDVIHQFSGGSFGTALVLSSKIYKNQILTGGYGEKPRKFTPELKNKTSNFISCWNNGETSPYMNKIKEAILKSNSKIEGITIGPNELFLISEVMEEAIKIINLESDNTQSVLEKIAIIENSLGKKGIDEYIIKPIFQLNNIEGLKKYIGASKIFGDTVDLKKFIKQ